jgi:hypothetical protein
MRRKLLLGLTITVLLTTSIAACGNKDENVSGTSASASSEITNTPTTTTSTTAAHSATESSVPATSPKRFLVDVKALRVDGKDVVQFTFEGGTPGYAADYVTPPITDEGEGKPIAINGSNVMKLTFESSGTVDLTGGTKTYYTGPNRIESTDTTVISEVVKVSEYEGRLVFGIGTKAKDAFTISATGNIVTVSFA